MLLDNKPPDKTVPNHKAATQVKKLYGIASTGNKALSDQIVKNGARTNKRIMATKTKKIAIPVLGSLIFIHFSNVESHYPPF